MIRTYVNGERVLHITEYNTITDGETEYTIYDFEKKYLSNPSKIENFYYDEENNYFKLIIHPYEDEPNYRKIYRLYPSKRQRTFINNGIVDNTLKPLFDFAKQKQNSIKKEEIDAIVLATGELPSKSEEITLYEEYLEEQIKNTNAIITSSTRKLTSPIVFATMTISSIMLGQEANNWPKAIFTASLMVLGTFGAGITLFKYYGNSYYDDPQIGKLKQALKKSALLQHKLALLKEKKLALLEQSKNVSELYEYVDYEEPFSINQDTHKRHI